MDSNMHVAGHLTALGWTMLALYLVVALLAFRVAAISGSANSAAMGRVWICLGIILAVLGLNKQVDLQTLLIHFGRHIARREGLLAYRPELHFALFLGFTLTVIALLAIAMLRFSAEVGEFVRKFPIAVSGCGLICVYIVIRAALIDHVNRTLGVDPEGIPFIWPLEAGGLLLIMFQALRTSAPR
jgi:hypothetical protein